MGNLNMHLQTSISIFLYLEIKPVHHMWQIGYPYFSILENTYSIKRIFSTPVDISLKNNIRYQHYFPWYTLDTVQWLFFYSTLFQLSCKQFLSNIKNMKSERFNNFLLKINRKFVWHTAYLYRINYIIYGFFDYISKYIKSMKIFVTFLYFWKSGFYT